MRREPVDWVMSPCDGIGAGGRITFEAATGAALVGLTTGLATLEAAAGAELVDLTTRLVMGSEFLTSTGLTSAGFGSGGAGPPAFTPPSPAPGPPNSLATAT